MGVRLYPELKNGVSIAKFLGLPETTGNLYKAYERLYASISTMEATKSNQLTMDLMDLMVKVPGVNEISYFDNCGWGKHPLIKTLISVCGDENIGGVTLDSDPIIFRIICNELELTSEQKNMITGFYYE